VMGVAQPPASTPNSNGSLLNTAENRDDGDKTAHSQLSVFVPAKYAIKTGFMSIVANQDYARRCSNLRSNRVSRQTRLAGGRMTKFSVERRDLLRALGAGTVGSAALPGERAEAATSGGDLLWAFEAGVDVYSSPTIVDGTVYVGGDDMYALDADSGTENWKLNNPGIVGASPTVAGGTVYVGGNDIYDGTSNVYALDTTGEELWRFETDDRLRSSPTVAGGTVYVGSYNGTVYALDAATGGQEWAFPTEGIVDSSPTVVDDTVYVGSDDNTLYALDGATGEAVWQFETNDFVRSSPTVVDGTVYVGSHDNNLYAVDAASGDPEWVFGTLGLVYSGPTVADGTVYVGSQEGTVYAVDAASGGFEWEFLPFDPVSSSPTVAGDTVYIGCYDGNLYALGRGSGNQRWAFETGGIVNSSPTVVDGTVYVGSFDGNVYAVDAGVEGRSEGSRVNLGTLGHHEVWADQPPPADLVVDATAGEDDPAYQTIQAAVDNAEEGDVIEVLEGTYEGPVVLDKTVTLRTSEGAVVDTGLTDDEIIPTPVGFLVDAEVTPGIAPTLRGFTVDCTNCDISTAVLFSGLESDWTVEDMTVDGDLGTVISAAGTSGDWTVSGLTVSDTASPGRLISAGESVGDWVVRDSTLAGSRPVDAEDTGGAWRIENCTVNSGDSFPAIDATGAAGDWHVVETDIETSGTALLAEETLGDWQVTGPGDIVGATVGVNANDAEGAWKLHRTNFLSMAEDGTFHILANAVTDPPGNARRNFFEGTEPLIGGTGDEVDVLIGNQLAAPAGPDETGVSVTVVNAIDGENDCDPNDPLCEPTGDGKRQPGATVYLFDTAAVTVGPDGDIRDERAETLTELLELLDGQELVFNDDVDSAATRAVDTGPEGLVRYNGLDPETEYCLLVTPPRDSSGNVWTACPTVESETVTAASVTLTDTTHFGYLREDPFVEEVTDDWGEPISDTTDTLAETRAWLDRHRDERIELLRAANMEAAVVSKPFEEGDGATNTLIAGGGKILNEILESPKDPSDLKDPFTFAKEIAEGVAIDWATEKLRSYVAGWGTRRLDQVSTQKATQTGFTDLYSGYADELDTEWITKPHLNEPQGYDELDTVVDAGGRIDAVPDDIDTLRGSTPPADLNHQHVRDVFRQFYDRVQDTALLFGIADNSDEAPDPPEPPTSTPTPDVNVDPGVGTLLSRSSGSPPDVLFLPDGTVYNTVKGGEAYPQLQRAADELTKDQPADILGNFFSAVSLVGKALIVLGVTSKAGVVVVAFAEAGETAADLVSELQDASLEWALGGFYMTLQLDTLHDIEALAFAFEAHRDWLDGQLADPITGAVDGELTTVQPPISVPSDEDIVDGSLPVTAENVGQETVPTRVLGYVLFTSTQTYEDKYSGEEYTTTLTQQQSFMATEPAVGANPAALSPGETFESEMEYAFQIPDDRPLSSSTFTYVTELYLGGKRVDRRTESVEISTDSQAVSSTQSAAALADVSARYSTAGLSTPVSATDQHLDEYRTDTQTLLDTRIDPGQSETVTTTVPGDAAFARVSLVAGSETAADLTVEANGETVTAQNGSVLLPTDTDIGEVTLTVQASAVRSSPVPVTLSLISVPGRPAVLGTIPAALTGTPALGSTFRPGFELAEVGVQQPVDGLTASLSGLTNAAGTDLPANGEVTLPNASVPAGERLDVGVAIDLPGPDEVDLSGEPTRFDGELTVTSDNAGEMMVPVSVLLLDSPFESARLAGADPSVTAVRLSNGDLPEGAPEPTGEIQSVYEVTVTGEGTARVRLPEPTDAPVSGAVRLVDGEYESVEFQGGTASSAVTLPAGSYPLVVTVGPEALPGYERPPQDIDGDGLYEDVDGDGVFDIFDVQALFNGLDSDPVQSNPEAFNFDEDENPDSVGLLDVQALFEEVAEP
jgi:outer membrane protein assembly factor BamB